ncbi:beta-ketoacyl synthase N-terminal-like domain-containing protein [uncultured Shewanella sp.]|uniref:hotdog fold thioesterase n=1 Tax=uncultured Shewanella sp. TaxID=173975 RepID=UPI002630B784|nr:beta-ketoacyl synthase N-terminal-like domain-containing protein [uncultured Shewanella sp.]
MSFHNKKAAYQSQTSLQGDVNKGNKIAIVGLAALYPEAHNVETFWQNLLHRKDVRSSISERELGANVDDYKGEQGQSDRFYCSKGSYIRQFNFDPSGYQLSEAQLQDVDTSVQWVLDTSRKALSDAGIVLSPDTLARVGVVMGALSFPTRQSNKLFLPLYNRVVEKALKTRFTLPKEQSLALAKSFQMGPKDFQYSTPCNYAQLVAKALGLGGVHFNLDAACASSVYSLKLACDYLNQQKADVMLAAAVSGADPFVINMGFSIFHAYPDNDVSVPFDQRSQGLFAGEGAGVLVLKRLNDAIESHDHIYAVVDGVGLSNDGKGQFVLSPNSKGQVKAYERAYCTSGIEPKEVEVVECHATGTPLGDKVELTSMEQFFSDKLEGTPAPLIGSVKSNLGHLLTAAGMPGMMKMIYSMNTGQLPPSINIEQVMSSPSGLFAEHSFFNEVIDWPDKKDKQNGHRRHAGVSVFGFGGCNAHLVLSSFQHVPVEESHPFAIDSANQAGMEVQTVKPLSERGSIQPLVVTGLAAHFGPFDDINALDSAIQNKQDGFITLPTQRWKGIDKHPDILADFGLKAVPKGAYIDRFQLDFLHFKLPPNEDDRLIPQQLLLMKVADEAIRDAGLKSGQHVAVLVAMEAELELHQFRGRVNLHSQLQQSLKAQGISLTNEEYQALESISMDSILPAAKLNQYTSFIGNIMASRVASIWNFSGPAFTVSAAEQSVSRCLDIAHNWLSQIDDKDPLEAVVIAAVDLSGSIEKVYTMGNIQPVAIDPNDAIKGFKDSVGTSTSSYWNVGEGAGAVVLQAQNHSALKQVYAEIAECVANEQQAQKQPNFDAVTLEDVSVSCVESSIAPSLNAKQLSAQLETLKLQFPQAQYSKMSDRAGHTFAAAGMASLLHLLLHIRSTPVEQQNSDYVNGLMNVISEDEQFLLLVRQTKQQQQTLESRVLAGLKSEDHPTANKPVVKLIKEVVLGGEDIFQTLLNNELKEEAAIQLKFNEWFACHPIVPPEKLSLENCQEKSIIRFSELMALHQRGIVATEHEMATMRQEGEKMDLIETISTSTLNTEQRTNLQTVLPSYLTQRNAMQDVHSAFLTTSEQALLLRGKELQLKYCGGEHDLEEINVEHKQFVQAPSLQVKESSTEKACIWNFEDLQEYAEGNIANVFGPEYAIIDTYTRRVRLPTTDYLLVSRVTKLDATIHEFKPSSMTTEYDIPIDAPYLLDGQILWAVAVESGQCDLMLISYLGIDFENKGERVYRLLDCSLTFLGDLPRAGDTLRYDIKINHFARNGDTLLFFFSYECFVDDTMILKMDDGCAGFFTDAELADGKGVIKTESDIAAREQALKQVREKVTPLLHCEKTSFNLDDMSQLSEANLAGCFGESHVVKGLKQTSLSFTSRQFLMIESVSRVDINGGAWGLGFIEAHKSLAPDHWYFPCHFKDDPVMAGSLMAEGCGQLLQFFMLYLGMHTLTQSGRFQPLVELTQKVRCRGQVIPQFGQLTYQMEITELGLSPRPYAKANVDILLNGKVVVDFRDLGVVLKEEEECRRYQGHLQLLANGRQESNNNAPLMQKVNDLSADKNKGVIPFKHVPAPVIPDYPNREPDTLPFTPYHLFEFATGNIEYCFGEDFAVYRHRISPRTPCGDLQLTTRVIDIQGIRGDFNSEASCIAEYEVPSDAWFFRQNNHPAKIPYSILMEISLQPNGFISGYMGTTLQITDEDLFFRNLDGKGRLLREVDLRGKTIVNRSVLLSTVVAGKNIIQRFTFSLSCNDEVFYEGEASFGYFTQGALTHQLGLDNGQITQSWYHQQQRQPDHHIDLGDKNSRYFCGSKEQPYFKLAGGQLHFIDEVDIVEQGGSHGLGYAFAKRTIDPSDWFFQCHFHQDPVMPGSLGVEAIIELMQVYVINQNLGADFNNPKINHILSEIEWKYRGQINPLNTHMSVDVHITEIRHELGKKVIIGKANLSKDGLRIYEVNNIAICIEEASE